MAPLPRSSICLPIARQHQKTPLRLVAIMFSQSSSLHSSAATAWAMPALQTRISIFGKAARAVAAISLTLSGSRTSTSTNSERRPMASISAAALRPISGTNSAMMISAPAPASLRAVAKPMPRPAPVIKAVVPVRSKSGLLIVCLFLGKRCQFNRRDDTTGFPPSASLKRLATRIRQSRILPL